jgi:mannitol/fructose-specific phosphotransferase system IIA component (Ntr-type)
MLRELLSQNKLVAVKVRASDWKDAVRAGVGLLADAGYTKQAYADAIIDDTEKLGPYYVIGPGIALPHSKADNVMKVGVSIITLATAVRFHHANDPVDLLITLAALDKSIHYEMLAEVVDLISSPDRVAKMRNCQTELELLELIK